jgi:predicted nucleic acid-binding protein
MERSKGHRQKGRVREAAAARYAAAPQELTGVLYDTDVVVEVLRGRGAVVEAVRGLEAAGVPTYCTAISWAEIYAGMRAGEEPLTRAFFEARGEVVLDARVGRRAGAYLARYARSHGVEIADALVAAAAATSGLWLWTLNRKHYPMQDVRFYEARSPKQAE